MWKRNDRDRPNFSPRSCGRRSKSLGLEYKFRKIPPRFPDLGTRGRAGEARSHDLEARSHAREARSHDLEARSHDLEARRRDREAPGRRREPQSLAGEPQSLAGEPRSRAVLHWNSWIYVVFALRLLGDQG